jgi:hypothetical protein
MSLKSFHIIFIFVCTIFMAYFCYWSLNNWFNYKDISYLVYSFLSIVSFLILILYSNSFMKKYKEIIS